MCGGAPFYACPSGYGSVDCARAGDRVAPLSCTALDGYHLGFGIDTAVLCYYDRASHALVGVLEAGNASNTCYGTVDDTCTESPVNLCSGGSLDASADGD